MLWIYFTTSEKEYAFSTRKSITQTQFLPASEDDSTDYFLQIFVPGSELKHENSVWQGASPAPPI